MVFRIRLRLSNRGPTTHAANATTQQFFPRLRVVTGRNQLMTGGKIGQEFMCLKQQTGASFLYFLPLPHGQGSLQPTLERRGVIAGSKIGLFGTTTQGDDRNSRWGETCRAG